jgi:hypothetical protein
VAGFPVLPLARLGWFRNQCIHPERYLTPRPLRTPRLKVLPVPGKEKIVTAEFAEVPQNTRS